MAYHHPDGSISICFNQPKQFSDASTAVFPSIKFDRWKDGQRTIWKLNNCKTISDGHLFYLFRLFGWPVSIFQSRSMEVLWKIIINQGTTLSLAFWIWQRSRLPSLFTLLFGDTTAMRSLWCVEVTRCSSYLSSQKKTEKKVNQVNRLDGDQNIFVSVQNGWPTF